MAMASRKHTRAPASLARGTRRYRPAASKRPLDPTGTCRRFDRLAPDPLGSRSRPCEPCRLLDPLAARGCGTTRFDRLAKAESAKTSWRIRCRRIATSGFLGCLRRSRKFPCQPRIAASRLMRGGIAAHKRSDLSAPVVGRGGGDAALPSGRVLGVALRRGHRRGHRVWTNARTPIRARADANRHRPRR